MKIGQNIQIYLEVCMACKYSWWLYIFRYFFIYSYIVFIYPYYFYSLIQRISREHLRWAWHYVAQHGILSLRNGHHSFSEGTLGTFIQHCGGTRFLKHSKHSCHLVMILAAFPRRKKRWYRRQYFLLGKLRHRKAEWLAQSWRTGPRWGWDRTRLDVESDVAFCRVLWKGVHGLRWRDFHGEGGLGRLADQVPSLQASSMVLNRQMCPYLRWKGTVRHFPNFLDTGPSPHGEPSGLCIPGTTFGGMLVQRMVSLEGWLFEKTIPN